MLSHTGRADNRLYAIEQDIGERADQTFALGNGRLQLLIQACNVC
jgi:hypothetical protein